MHMIRPTQRRSAGFSLVEVMVTGAVVSIGLLGIAKMTAAAVSNTQVARVRSLVALQADSLVGAMHGNRGFWAAGLAPASFSASGTTVVDSTDVLTQEADCASGTCTPAQLAASDVQHWARNLNAQFPSYAAAVSCTTSVATPISCTITVTWSEKYIAINRSTAAATTSQTATQRFSLHVEP
jgi:type IV pilus assembly protein PilV